MGLFSSSSKSSSTSSTINQDNRVVADAQAQAVSNGGQTAKDYAQPISINVVGGGKKSSTVVPVTVTPTDYGAIQGALTFADETSDAANKTVQDVLGVSAETFDKATKALQDAYTDSKGGALVLQNVTIGMMITIGAIAYFWLVKGKKQ